jgi:hypothetical protein
MELAIFFRIEVSCAYTQSHNGKEVKLLGVVAMVNAISLKTHRVNL